MKVMKVGLFTEWYLPIRGGVSSHVSGLYKELKRRGHEVKIFTKRSKFRQERKSTEEDVVELNPTFPLDLPILPPSGDETLKVISSYDLDIVHSHHAFTATPLAGLSYAEKLGIPRVLTNHSIPAGKHDGYFWETVGNLAYPVRYYINKAEVVIAVSKAAANFISFFVDYAPIKIIPNGIDTSKFKPNFDKENKELRILFVSRLVHRKGPHLLIRAFKRVIKKFDNVSLTFVGSGYMKGTLEELAMSLNITNKIKFLGDVPDESLPQVYSESDIFVLPSLHAESFGLVLLEAMASGLPVVATNVGGIPEVLEDGKEGFLVKPDERSIADALIKLLEDENLRKAMGKNGRKKAVEKYDWKNVGEKIEETYKELL